MIPDIHSHHRTPRVRSGMASHILMLAIMPQLCLFVFACACIAKPAIDIGDLRELFVDKHTIASLDNLSLKMHAPHLSRISASPTENGDFCTVIYDRNNHRYHYYYRRPWEDSEQSEHFHTAYFYMTSDDGIDWEKPDLNMYPQYGSDAKNMILKPEDPVSHNFSPLLDTRPGVPPHERFKAVAGATDKWSSGKGLYGFVSGDGIHWRQVQEAPIIPQDIEGHDMEANNYFDSQNVAFWSDIEGVYVCYYRVTWLPQPGGLPQSLRGIARATSPDFIHWTHDKELPVNMPGEHFYANQTSPYFRAPHIYLALAWRYFPPVLGNVHNHPSDTILMSSRGAGGYDRTFTGAFIKPGMDDSYWSKDARPMGAVTALNIVPVGPHTMSIYSGDKRYTLRLDGFASLNAPDINYGYMTTKPLVFSGTAMEINYQTSAAGRIFVELQDESGKPIPGYSLDDCETIIGNEISHTIKWNNQSDLSSLAGKTIRVHIKMRDADVYSYRFFNPVDRVD